MNVNGSDRESLDWCKIAERYIPDSRTCRIYRVLEDTTDFFQVNYGDVMLLNDVGYLVRGTESEKKFGLEGEPKPWVKSCVDLVTGHKKIVKLTFLEEFACHIAGTKFTCLRNPEKEARVLEKVRGHLGFMQGFHVYDAAGNNVRVIERVAGRSLDTQIRSIPTDHETYYHEHLPEILDGLHYAFRSMADLHELGEIHGDISPDHIFVETGTGRYRWIDFDYDYQEQVDLVKRDVFEMGTLLSFVVGKEYVAYADLKSHKPEIAGRLTPADMQSVFPNQVANLKLVFPYIDEALNAILLRFSAGSSKRYETAGQLASDLGEVIPQIKSA